MSNFALEIKELRTDHGKLLGGCIYAGFPLERTIDIHIKGISNTTIYVRYDLILAISEELEPCFMFTNVNKNDWKDYDKLLKDEFHNQINLLGKKFDETYMFDFFGVVLSEDIFTEKMILEIGSVIIEYNENTKTQIDEFLKSFIKCMTDFYNDAIDLYNKKIDIIKFKK